MKTETMKGLKVERRGRPKKAVQIVEFDPTDVKLFRGSELSFSEALQTDQKSVSTRTESIVGQ